MDLPVRKIKPHEPDNLVLSRADFIGASKKTQYETVINYCVDYCKLFELKETSEILKTLLYLYKNKIMISKRVTKKVEKEILENGIKKKVKFDETIEVPIPYAEFENKLYDTSHDYISSQVLTALDVKPVIIDPDYYQYLLANKKPNPKDFLLCTEFLMPNLDAAMIEKNLNNLILAVNTLWARLSQGDDQPQQFMYLFSNILGGSGKGTFCKLLQTWAKNKGVKYGSAEISSDKFSESVFNETAIAVIQEAREDQLKNWPKMNDIIDGISYKIEGKNQTPYYAKPQCLLIVCSNEQPVENNPRRLRTSYIYFKSDGFVPMDANSRNFFKWKTDPNNGISNIDFEAYIPIIEKWILSVPLMNYHYPDISQTLLGDAYKWASALERSEYWKLQEIVKALNTKWTKEKWTAEDIYDTMRKNSEYDKEKKLGRKSIASILATLNQKGMITKTKENVNEFYVQYDLAVIKEDADSIISGDVNFDKISSSAGSHNFFKEEQMINMYLNAVQDYSPSRNLLKFREELKKQ